MNPTGIVCEDRADARRSIAVLMTRCGFEVIGQAESWSALRTLVQRVEPTVIVLALPVPGMNSLAMLGSLRRDAPTSAVVVLSSFYRLLDTAIKAGAAALLPEGDPQALQAVLRGIAAGTPDAVVVAPSGGQFSVPAQRTELDASIGRLSTNPAS